MKMNDGARLRLLSALFAAAANQRSRWQRGGDVALIFHLTTDVNDSINPLPGRA